MKTVGELRKLIVGNGGELIIGVMSYSCHLGSPVLNESGDVVAESTYYSDIDIKLDGVLLQWINSGTPDHTLLSELGKRSTIDSLLPSSIVDDKEKENALARVDELEKKNVELENTILKDRKFESEAQKALGAVEAYEKLLLNRKVTLEN